MNKPRPHAAEVIISALLVVAPITRPAAIPPREAFHGSVLLRAASAKHSTDAKAAHAADINNAGRAIAREIPRVSDVAAMALVEVKRLTAPLADGVLTGSGYHASWTAPKNVPAAAPASYWKKVTIQNMKC